MTADHNRMSDIFHNVQERLLTAVLVFVNYPTPPSGELKEYEIGELSPDSSITDVETRFGDGVYRLVGVGSERSESGSVRQITRDSRTHRVAKGAPSLWEDHVKSVISRQFPEPDYERSSGHLPPSLSWPRNGISDVGIPDAGYQLPPMHTEMPSPDPLVIAMGDGENLIIARGLPPGDVQRKIEEAQSIRREDKEKKIMSDQLLEIMKIQMAAANAEKESAQRRAEENNKMLLEVLMGGSRRADAPASDDSRGRAMSEMVDTLRRQVADMEEKSRRDRNDHWDEQNRSKQRYAELEDQWRAERRKCEDLTSKLAKADIDAMLAGAKGPGGDSDEEKLQRKVAMFAQLAHGLSPMVGPILAKMGITSGADPQLPGSDPSAGMPSGDLGGGSQ